MLKLVLLAPSSISGREREDAAVLEFGQGRVSNSSTFVKHAVARGQQHHEIPEQLS